MDKLFWPTATPLTIPSQSSLSLNSIASIYCHHISPLPIHASPLSNPLVPQFSLYNLSLDSNNSLLTGDAASTLFYLHFLCPSAVNIISQNYFYLKPLNVFLALLVMFL